MRATAHSTIIHPSFSHQKAHWELSIARDPEKLLISFCPDIHIASLRLSESANRHELGEAQCLALLIAELGYINSICVGLQLTLDNALAPYLNNQFGFSITKAGNLAAIYGCMNFLARPAGGILSDVLGKRFGIRGRVWALFMVFSLGGLFTALVGVLVNHSFNVTLAMYILSGIFLEVRNFICSLHGHLHALALQI